MPLLQIHTNVTLADERRAEILSGASAIMSSLTGKAERWVMVQLLDGEPMRFGGDDAPCCYLEAKSIGLPVERTGEFAARLSTFVDEELSVPADRTYIEFSDAPRTMWGFNGNTFA